MELPGGRGRGGAFRQKRACPACRTIYGPLLKFRGQCGASLLGPDSTATASPAVAPLPTSCAGGRYGVRRFLGEGGRKRVYLAHDQRLKRNVAVAIVKADELEAQGLSRVQREAQAMAKLSDRPNVVTIYYAGDDNGHCCASS